MTLSCNCDMPAEIYADWLQDQGWDTEELREHEEVVPTYSWYGKGSGSWFWNEIGNGMGRGDGRGIGYGNGYGNGPTYKGNAT